MRTSSRKPLLPWTILSIKSAKVIRIVVSEDGRTDQGNTANEQITADYLTALFVKAKTLPFLEGIGWYELEDIPNGRTGLRAA